MKTIKGFDPTDTGKDFRSGAMAMPPFRPGQAKNMERAAPKGDGGRSFSLSNNAKYGTEGVGGPEPTTMSRKTMKAPGGRGASSLPPNTASYGTKGSEGTGQHSCYGCDGVDAGGNAGQYRGM